MDDAIYIVQGEPHKRADALYIGDIIVREPSRGRPPCQQKILSVTPYYDRHGVQLRSLFFVVVNVGEEKQLCFITKASNLIQIVP